MNILPKDKDKKIQFIFAIFCTLVVLGLIWLFLIQPQDVAIRELVQKHQDEMTKLDNVKQTIKQADQVSAQLTEVTNSLVRAEADMASGDVYEWTYETIRRFKANYHVDIPTITQPSMGEVDLVPQFPYKQIKISISGTAYYHDLGKFVADFENTFPHIRIVNLTLEPATGIGVSAEKLAFRMDIVALVKPTS